MHPQPYPTRPQPTRPWPAPVLHLLHGRWIASCATCGLQLAIARSQARVERRSRHRTCPICHQAT